MVDDDPDLLEVVSDLLRLQGYEVVAACDGRQGIDAAEKRLPDLILLDMRMPVMNGAEFALEFRRRFDHLAPIVVITAADDAQRRAADVGAEGWVGKPFEISELFEVVARHIRARA